MIVGGRACPLPTEQELAPSKPLYLRGMALPHFHKRAIGNGGLFGMLSV